jgi:Acyl-CoA synthetases (AMP-forming)/AMP-acid ligases II
MADFFSGLMLTNARRAFEVHSAQNPFRGSVGDVLDLARRAVTGLAGLGVDRGDVVVVQLPNWLEAVVAIAAVVMRGAVVAPVPSSCSAVELEDICRSCRAHTLIVPEKSSSDDVVEELLERVGWFSQLENLIVVGRQPKRCLPFNALIENPVADRRLMLAVDPRQPATIGFTSGSEDAPKGVVHSHQTLRAEVAQLAQIQPPDEPPTLVGAPIAHAIGMLSGLLLPLQLGKPIHLIDVWNPRRVLEAMRDRGLTAGSGSPFFVQSLIDHEDFSEEHRGLMRYMGLGGAPVTAETISLLDRNAISAVRVYGSTEHPSATGSRHSDGRYQRTATDGRPLAGVEIRVLRDDKYVAGVGEVGNLYTRGPDLAIGYIDPDMVGSRFDEDGWFRTGDLGKLDAEGCLTIAGRSAGLIIRGGQNISGSEVERALSKLFGVREAVVLGIPDEHLGERVAAFVRLDDPQSPSATLRDIRKRLRATGLTVKKLPERLYVLDEFPRTPSGKIDRSALLDERRNQDGGL